MNDNPKTDALCEQMMNNKDSARVMAFRLVIHACALERKLNQEKIWKVEDPRMLREQMRVHDMAYQHLFDENKRLKEQILDK